ncbi:MAG: DHA2 family efflux MFS transporter permease subunit [Polyangiaceae bacterium]
MSQAAALPAVAVPAAKPFVVNKWAVAIAVAIGALMEIIDTSIVNVALNDIQASLAVTLSQVSWVVSSYGVANVIVLPLAAWLGHRFGKKRYFLFSLFGFLLSSVMCGLAANLWVLILARVAQGLTGGGLLAKAQSILFETFPREEQAKAQAFFAAIVIAGPTIGPTLGGYIVTTIGWRWIFFINVPIGIAAVAAVSAFLPPDEVQPEAKKEPIDWAAIGMLAVGLGALETFLEEGNDEGWFDSTFIWALAAVSAVALVLFVRRVLRAKDPVVDLRVLRHRSLWAGSILSAVIGMALYGALFSIPIYAQTILHFTSQQTGLLLLPGALASAVGMIVAGRIVGRFDPRVLLLIGAAILLSALYMFAHMNPNTGERELQIPLVVRSIGTVLMFLPLQLSALGPLPKEEIAAGTGFYQLTRQLGGSVGVALLTALLDHRLKFHTAVLSEKLVANDPHTLERVNLLAGAMLARGADMLTARARALTILAGSVKQQALIMSFGDTFWATAALVFLSLPLVMLLGKPKKGVKMGAGH